MQSKIRAPSNPSTRTLWQRELAMGAVAPAPGGTEQKPCSSASSGTDSDTNNETLEESSPSKCSTPHAHCLIVNKALTLQLQVEIYHPRTGRSWSADPGTTLEMGELCKHINSHRQNPWSETWFGNTAQCSCGPKSSLAWCTRQAQSYNNTQCLSKTPLKSYVEVKVQPPSKNAGVGRLTLSIRGSISNR